ncbi:MULTISPECIES: DUF2254 domain-containing protein [Rhodococcus]|uniref:DUF2254 domain-containing protein n=1 Tax=Rhodococcus TaxID=1827 RepID=UPI0007EA43BB|nr:MULTISPECIES: DUF2254 domain-containing protein [Rhodococcus]OBA38229.1 hypothetical protein A5767_05775 [Rhodococcus sp. 852002-51564_SCH6189132-a]QQM55717.1 DUF2254 domain-containing protein [Rhodococcus pyridinivorans]
MTGPRGHVQVFDVVRARRRVLVEALRSRLWPLPAAAVLLAVLAGIGVPELDTAVDDHMPAEVAGYLFGGSADAARELLGAIAGSLITVTSLTFSLTLVTLQLASSQYSPRLLRTFAADRVVQRTLALFLSTFIYALTVLRTVRNDTDAGTSEFVPQLAVTLAYALTVASVVSLVLFLGHLVRQIRVETVLDQVRADTCATAADILPRATTGGGPEQPLPEPPPHAHLVEAADSGFVVEIDERAVLDAAVRAEAFVWIDRPVGDPVVAGTPIAFCSSGQPERTLAREARDRLTEQIRSAVRTGSERTVAQDVGYGLRQLTDVVVRALSPGINDPTTAVHGLVACTAVLVELLSARLGPYPVCDSDNRVRVVIARPTFADLLELVCTQPRLYGATDPEVLEALLSMLHLLAWKASADVHRLAVGDQLARLRADISDHDGASRRRLERRADDIEEAFARRWSCADLAPRVTDTH